MTYTEEKAFVKEKAKKLKIELPSAGWYLPMGKNCLIARLPTRNRTEGGLYLADTDTELPLYGLLISAGLQARDIMLGALIEIGDVIKFGKYEGSADEFSREASKQGVYLLQMKIEAINGSIEADKRAEDMDLEVVDTDDGPQHMWTPRQKTATRKAS